MSPPINPSRPAPPSSSSEVRAWILATVVILVQTVAIVWWAATLSANFDSLKESILRDRIVYADHEQRIRQLEKRPNP